MGFLTGLAITGGVFAGVALFTKYCPKSKLLKWTLPITTKLANFINLHLPLKVGKKAAERLEEGLMFTIADVLIENCKKFKEILKSDNEE